MTGIPSAVANPSECSPARRAATGQVGLTAASGNIDTVFRGFQICQEAYVESCIIFLNVGK